MTASLETVLRGFNCTLKTTKGNQEFSYMRKPVHKALMKVVLHNMGPLEVTWS